MIGYLSKQTTRLSSGVSKSILKSFGNVFYSVGTTKLQQQTHEMQTNELPHLEENLQEFLNQNKYELTPGLSVEEIQDLCESCGIQTDRLLAIKMLVYPADSRLLARNNQFNLLEVIKQCNVGYVWSWNGEFFPGTQKRVLLFNGKGVDVVNCLAHFLPALHVDRQFRMYRRQKQAQYDNLQVVLVVADNVAGDIIGINNTNLQQIQADSEVEKLYVEAKQDMLPLVQDRLFYISGTPTAVLRGIVRMIGKVSQSENYIHFQGKHASEHSELKWINKVILSALKENLIGTQAKYKAVFNLNKEEMDKLHQGGDLESSVNKYVRRLEKMDISADQIELRGGYTSVQRGLGICMAKLAGVNTFKYQRK
eukprot:TRINITY_DN955_c0_g2_i1.p1 TRINITY_DN955_c0_g2~~TRINITY_DN955_c0_g2_i1.p1  ORF type:complete len:366 (+),score=26.78 TRINITY_DN955_c0_g2_i1:99-1196(+)